MRASISLAALALLLALAPAVQAQISTDELVGTWVQDTRGTRQSYSFGSDYSYTFRSGRRSGYISHAGNWVQMDNGMITIQPETRVQARRGRERTVRAARMQMVLEIQDIGDGFISIDGVRFTRG